MPRQGRAFDPGRVGLDPGQRLEPVHLLGERLRQLLGRLAAGHPRMELREERPRLGYGLALEHFGHQRGRRGRNRAAPALEADIGDPVAVERQVDRHPVAAQRVIALREMRRMLDRPEIPRVPAVIEDDVLIKLAQIHHRKNISRAASSASASRSISLSSL